MRLVTILICSILISSTVFAQKGKREQIKALKVSFITEKLNLTVKEAQLFWPIYNAYEQDMHKYKYISLRKLRQNVKENFETLTDKQAEHHLDQFIELENKVHQAQSDFMLKLRGIIPAKKIIALKSAEEDFKRKILDQFRKYRNKINK